MSALAEGKGVRRITTSSWPSTIISFKFGWESTSAQATIVSRYRKIGTVVLLATNLQSCLDSQYYQAYLKRFVLDRVSTRDTTDSSSADSSILGFVVV